MERTKRTCKYCPEVRLTPLIEERRYNIVKIGAYNPEQNLGGKFKVIPHYCKECGYVEHFLEGDDKKEITLDHIEEYPN